MNWHPPLFYLSKPATELVTELVTELITEFVSKFVPKLVSKLVSKLERLNVIQTKAPSVPYSGSGNPTALQASTIRLTPVPQLSTYFRSVTVILGFWEITSTYIIYINHTRKLQAS